MIGCNIVLYIILMINIVSYIILVRVLCEDKEADYSIVFRNFAETDLSYRVEYVSSPPKTNKYILLFKVKSRIPEDLQHVIQKLYSKG